MAELSYFTALANFKAIVADTPDDGDADPDLTGLTGTVTFTAALESGDLVLATGLTAGPTGLMFAPIQGCIDSDGIMKLGYVDSNGDVQPRTTPWGAYSYTPVRLVADTATLELEEALWYNVTFSNMSYNGKFVSVNGFSFQAPNGDIEFDLIENALPGPGVDPTALTKIAPAGVRIEGDTLVFTFGGVDIPDPVPLERITLPDYDNHHAAQPKTTPVDADEIPLADSADSYALKKLTWANLKATLGAWYDTAARSLTNKTISGTSNTLSNIGYASLTDDVAKMVWFSVPGDGTAEGGANTWAKVLTVSLGTVQYSSTQILLGFVSQYKNGTSGDDSAIVSVHASVNGTGTPPTLSVHFIGKGGGGSVLAADSFKLVSNGWDTPIELWLKKTTTYAGMRAYLLGLSSSSYMTLAWNNNATWQSATPSGSTTATSGGLTAFGVPVVTTTGTQTLSNKTLTNPTISYIYNASGVKALTLGGSAGNTTSLEIDSGTEGGNVTLSAVATNSNIAIVPKGTGRLVLNQGQSGSDAAILANGADASVSLNLQPKGSGTIKANGVDVVTTSGAATLSNKTISGASNTITNLPASATPDAARIVCTTATGGATAEDGANTWAKVATINLTQQARAATLILGVTLGRNNVGSADNVILSVYCESNINTPGYANKSNVDIIGGSLGVLAADGFKIISGGYGTPYELWVKKTTTYGFVVVSELNRAISSDNVTVTYHDGAPWQSATPTGAVTNVVSQGMTFSGVPVVTTTGTATLTNKTLTNPTITGYTESVVAIGTVTTSHTLSLTNGTVQTATLTASTACTFTMPTPTAGQSFSLFLKQAAATGNGTATFTGVKWNGDGAPTITATAGTMDILSFVSDGTNWYGSYTQGYTP